VYLHSARFIDRGSRAPQVQASLSAHKKKGEKERDGRGMIVRRGFCRTAETTSVENKKLERIIQSGGKPKTKKIRIFLLSIMWQQLSSLSKKSYAILADYIIGSTARFYLLGT
jgi:hypothetical protein